MNPLSEQPIHGLLEKTMQAYNISAESHCINSDFAEFASMSISEFQTLLGKPHMSAQNLRHILRAAHKAYRTKKAECENMLESDRPELCWSCFMGDYVTDQSNDNGTFNQAAN